MRRITDKKDGEYSFTKDLIILFFFFFFFFKFKKKKDKILKFSS